MCLILVGWRVHAEFPLVLAANRDEFHSRPSAPAHWWPDHPRLLAGRDQVAGGSWLAVTRDGRMAALTNFRDPSRGKSNAPSRGELVVRLAESSDPIERRLQWLREHSARFAPFNMLISDGAQLAIFESVSDSYRFLSPGIYGLSNHLLDTPWPKVRQAKSRLTEALRASPGEEALLHLLRDEQIAQDDQLPRTGVSVEWERLLSSAFIRDADYGTRCSTVIRMRSDACVSFREWTWDAKGSIAGEARHEFSIEPPDRPFQRES